MKFKKESLKSHRLAVSLLAVGILVGAIVGYSFEQGGTTFTIASGLYPGAPSYTVWREGNTYYAKDMYGAMLFDYPAGSSNASQIIQSVINVADGMIFFKEGTYAFTAGVTLPISGTDMIAGEGRKKTIFHFQGSSKGFIVPNGMTSITFKDLTIRTDGTAPMFTNNQISQNWAALRFERVIFHTTGSPVNSNVGEWGLIFFQQVAWFSGQGLNMSTTGFQGRAVYFIDCELNVNCTITLGNYINVEIIGGDWTGRIDILSGLNQLTFTDTIIGMTAGTYGITSSNPSGITINKLIIVGSVYPASVSNTFVDASKITIGVFRSSLFNYNYNLLLPNQTSPSLPVNPPVSGTVYRNTAGQDLAVYLRTYATVGGTPGYVTISLSKYTPPSDIGNEFVDGSTTATYTHLIYLGIPDGWYYKFTATGVTLGIASVLPTIGF